MKARISIEIQGSAVLTENDVIEIVGWREFERIKSEQPGGILKAFVLCNETEATPNIPGEGTKKITFPRRAVQSAFDKIKNGIKFFDRHNADNSTAGRKPYGEVVGKSQRIIDGNLSAIVVGHFPREVKDVATASNVISMEAVWDIIEEAGRWIAEGVDKITGIALGKSGEVTPGFSGAAALATVQAYRDHTMENTEQQRGRGDKPMDFWDLRDAIAYRRARPSQLYKIDEVIGRRVADPNTGKAVYDGGDQDINDLVEAKIVKPLSDRIADLENQVKKLTDENSGFKSKIAQAEAEPTIMKLAEEMKLPDRVKALAKSNIGSIKIGDDPNVSYKAFLNEWRS